MNAAARSFASRTCRPPSARSGRYRLVMALGLLLGVIASVMSTGVASAVVATALPNGDSAVQWTANAGSFDGTCGTRSAHCWRVDEGPAANPADYLGTGLKGSTGERLDFHLSTPAQASAATGLTLHMYVRDVDGRAQGGQFDSINMSLGFGAQSLAASSKVIGSSTWSWQSATWNGSFTAAQIDSMRAQFTRVRQGGSGKLVDQDDDLQIASVYVEVHSQPPSYEQSSYRWFANAAPPEPTVGTYMRALGRANFDEAGQAMTALADGSVVMASYGGPTFTGTAHDIFLTKVDPTGAEQWTSSLSASSNSDDTSHDVVATSDGGFVVIGDTNAYDPTHTDLLIAKFSASGVEQWSRTFGGTSLYDVGNAIIELSDGSLVFAGWQQTLSTGLTDIIVSKISADGSTVHWTKTLGGSSWDLGFELAELGDGSIILLSYGESYTNGGDDAYLTKLSSSGAVLWSTHVGSVYDEHPFAITPLSDGGFAVAGIQHTGSAADALLMKFGASGQEQWTSTIGGAGTDYGYEVVELANGELVFAGYTASNAAGNGAEDVFVSRFNSSGVEQWSKTMGGPGTDKVQAMAQAPNGQLVMGGWTTSYGTSGTSGTSEADMLLIQVNPDGTIANCPTTVCDEWHVTEKALSLDDPSPTLSFSVIDRTITLTARELSSSDYSPVSVETTVIPHAGASIPLPGAALAPQDAAATLVGRGQQVRLRMTLHASGPSLPPGSEMFKLQYAQRSDATCDPTFVDEQYVDVTTTAGPIRALDNSSWTDGMRTALAQSDPTHTGHTTVAQTYEENAAFHLIAPLAAGQDGLWDFSLQTSDEALTGDVYCFRIVRGDGTLLSTPATVPEIVIGSAQP
jgi:hypothetical protein